MRSTLKSLRIFGIVVLLAGVVMIGVSQHIKNEVAQGKLQIASGEQKVGVGKKIFGANQTSEKVGNTLFFDSADKKIAAGKQDIAEYTQMANQLQIGGIIAILIGAGMVVVSYRKKR